MDDMILDPNVLDVTADLIVIYCNKQKLVMDDYMRKMQSLSYEWEDEETIGRLLQEIRMLSNSVDRVMDIMRIKYPEYFKKQAEIIRHRTKYGP